MWVTIYFNLKPNWAFCQNLLWLIGNIPWIELSFDDHLIQINSFIPLVLPQHQPVSLHHWWESLGWDNITNGYSQTWPRSLSLRSLWLTWAGCWPYQIFNILCWWYTRLNTVIGPITFLSYLNWQYKFGNILKQEL